MAGELDEFLIPLEEETKGLVEFQMEDGLFPKEEQDVIQKVLEKEINKDLLPDAFGNVRQDNYLEVDSLFRRT